MSVEQIKTKILLLINNNILTECARADIGGVLSICTYAYRYHLHACVYMPIHETSVRMYHVKSRWIKERKSVELLAVTAFRVSDVTGYEYMHY